MVYAELLVVYAELVVYPELPPIEMGEDNWLGHTMGLEFQIHTFPCISLCGHTLRDAHDSRDGLDLIVFGLDHEEDCALLKEISNLIGFDLSFLKHPEGQIFNSDNPVQITECIDYLKRLSLALEQKRDFHRQLTYRYLNRDYFTQHGFETDIKALINYLACCEQHGAQTVWADYDLT